MFEDIQCSRLVGYCLAEEEKVKEAVTEEAVVRAVGVVMAMVEGREEEVVKGVGVEMAAAVAMVEVGGWEKEEVTVVAVAMVEGEVEAMEEEKVGVDWEEAEGEVEAGLEVAWEGEGLVEEAG